ncbi:uncharacterized protein LOC126264291 [Aethina tumida]|uniref:uncharacterized protein LOC126264291 n=1 Tax=Aethina tumida TaxID=116153 RepID=UPI002147F700|nr:uncharacterized protein LOC126264291 [Aethina tumida]
MKFFIASLFAVLAAVQAGVLVAPTGNVLQGPSSRTTVVGPDGSAISAVAPGGQIVTDESVGVVARTAPVVASPVLAHSAPILAQSAPLVAAAPLGVDTVVSGPSGVVAASRGLAAPWGLSPLAAVHGGLIL